MREIDTNDVKNKRIQNIRKTSGTDTNPSSFRRQSMDSGSDYNHTKSSFNVLDDIAVSDVTNEQAVQNTETQGENTGNLNNKRSGSASYLTKNGKPRKYSTSADIIGGLTGVSVDKGVGSFGSIVNHNPNSKSLTSAQQLQAMADIVSSDSYTRALKENATTTLQQIKRLQRKQQDLNKQVEYATLTENQLDDYSFQYDKYEKRIQQLITQYNTYEMKYMRQTGRDFKGNHSHNVVDVAMRDVKANKDYVDSLRFQIQKMENLATSSESAEQTKELILSKKRKELENAQRMLKESEQKTLEMQDWQESAEGQKKIARWEKQEARQAKRELASKSGIRGAINSKLDAAEGKAYSAFDKPRRAVNKAIDKAEYAMGTPFRAAKKTVDNAYSKVYESAMRSKTKTAVDNAFSSAGNAARKAAGNAKSTLAKAGKEAAKAVWAIFKKAFMFLLTNPLGWAIDALLIITLLFSGGLKGGEIVTEEDLVRGDERYSSETVYRQFLTDVEAGMIKYIHDEYRVALPSANVGAVIYSSIDPDVFEKMTEENYKDEISDLLTKEKINYATKVFLKQVDYYHYYLYVNWSPWVETDVEVGVGGEPPFDEIDTYEKEVEIEYEEPNYGACIYAPEYGYDAAQYNACIKNPPTKTSYRTEMRTFYKGRNVIDYNWAKSGLENPGLSPEKPRSTLRITVDRFVEGTDAEDRASGWAWFTPDDGVWVPSNYQGYFIKKEKYWQTWSFEELSELLSDNYNLVSNEAALVPPEGFDNFHAEGNVIKLYDTGLYSPEPAYQNVDIDMDRFYELMDPETQYSFYDYITAENEREPEGVAEQLMFMQTVMVYYGGNLFTDGAGEMSPEEIAAFLEALEGLDDSDIKRMLSYATQFMGAPYILGTEGPRTFDCSGFVYWVVNNCGNGWNVPRLTTYQMVNSEYYNQVPESNLQPGDIILIDWSNRGGDWSHVGIYMGNNLIIHTGGSPGVQFQYLNNPTYSHWYNCPKRYYRLSSKATGG